VLKKSAKEKLSAIIDVTELEDINNSICGLLILVYEFPTFIVFHQIEVNVIALPDKLSIVYSVLLYIMIGAFQSKNQS
jgi:hypothetical protein